MSIKLNIQDGGGSGVLAKVSPEGFLYTQEAPYPPIEEDTKITVYREFLSNTTGSTNMVVNGSTTRQYFSIQAEPDYDIYITTVSFLMASSAGSLQNFGSTTLTIGCRFFYEDNNGEITIGSSLRTNFDFVRLCQGKPAFGSGADSFRALNAVPTNLEAFLPVFDFRDFGFKWGLKLRANSLDKLSIEINDNITQNAFNAIAYGFRRKI